MQQVIVNLLNSSSFHFHLLVVDSTFCSTTLLDLAGHDV